MERCIKEYFAISRPTSAQGTISYVRLDHRRQHLTSVASHAFYTHMT